MQDEGLNELLPFGEYVPPEQMSSPPQMLMEMDEYDLNRLLASLALHSANGGSGRRTRAQRQAQRQAVWDSVVLGPGRDRLGAHMEASTSVREQRAGASAAVPTGAAAPESPLGGRGGAEFPASWPPAGSHDRNYEVRRHTM